MTVPEPAPETALTLADIWSGLRADHAAWIAAGPDLRASIDESDLSLLRELAAVEATRWQQLCDALGWTPLGAVALSWCIGANLRDTREAWAASGADITPDPASLRPARLLNPALLPERPRLSDLALTCEDDDLQLCILIAAAPEPLDIDLPPESLKTASPRVASLLHDILARRPEITERERMQMSLLKEIAASRMTRAIP